MTHPLRYKAPYAPKVGEWWEYSGVQMSGRAVQKDELTKSPKVLINDYVLEKCMGQGILLRRHFLNQAERDAAPPIPPVEGAKMLLRICPRTSLTAGFCFYRVKKY